MKRDFREKYHRFHFDLAEAVRVGREAEQDVPDDGTCNFDSASVYLPFWKAKEIHDAAHFAGIHAHMWTQKGVRSWVFTPDTTGQAHRRTVNAEAMCNELQRRGYIASMYYEMD